MIDYNANNAIPENGRGLRFESVGGEIADDRKLPIVEPVVVLPLM
jgi:hypothetical protein